MSDKKYYGWSNWETWNVYLWLSNDEKMYNSVRFLFEGGNTYETVVANLALVGVTKTGDGVRFDDEKVNGEEIAAAFADT